MEKLILVLIVLLHYLLILHVHLKFGRPKTEKRRTQKKFVVIWLKDWLLTPVIILSALMYLLSDGGGCWQTISFSPNETVKYLGGSLTVLGFILKYYAYQSLGRNWSAKCNIYNDHELVKQGPYKFLRHPVYMSYLLTMIGFGFISGNLLAFGFALAYHSLNSIRARHEEKMLEMKFGKSYNGYLLSSGANLGAIIMLFIIMANVIGVIDEIIYLPLTGRSFTLDWVLRVWQLLSS